MKKLITQIISLVMVFSMFAAVSPAVYAGEAGDSQVEAVITQLEAIDTLQQIQNNRSKYKVNSRYFVHTTDQAIISAHEAARLQYETYMEKMFAQRLAAQQAYDTLTDSQKAQIDPALVAKLSNTLDTVFVQNTYPVSPRNDEYTFEAVKNINSHPLSYETSHNITAGPQIPAIYILVDTADGKTNWTPNGKYVLGQSNFEAVYCCDVETSLKYGTDYKRLNLEDSGYYGPEASKHIRAILENSYPYITLEQMKANLKAGGLNAEFVDTLTRSDIISAVQMAVWAYANSDSESIASNVIYGATYDVMKASSLFAKPIHDDTNELWSYWTTSASQVTYDPNIDYRVNTLVYYLCNLPGVEAEDDQVVISDVKITRADLINEDDMYRVGMYIHLENGGVKGDNLKVSVTSSHTNDDGTVTMTSQNSQVVDGRTKIDISVKAKSGDTITVVVEGTQTVSLGVYFYEPEGGRNVSQCLVGIGQGKTNVKAEETFVFAENMGQKGLRIYKTENGTGLPLSEITFDIYSVVPAEGETINPTPTQEEIAKYQTEENKVGSVTTDATGYADITLENGIYLLVEQHNKAKILSPINPVYIQIPMTETVEHEDGTVTTQVVDVVAVYPKNETVTPPDNPPVIPPSPDNVTGMFEIIKHDEHDQSILLEGAKFEVYRPATAQDTDTKTILCGGVQYAAVPVMGGDNVMTLTTDKNGHAASPQLTCGTYFLVEIKSPAGYNQLSEAVSVTVVSSVMTQSTVYKIANQRGNILPQTGGIGTKIFVVGGGLLAAGAAILLVAKKRMEDEE